MKKLKYLPSLLMLVLCVGILAVGVFAIKPQQNAMSGAITIHGSNEEIELTAYLNSVSEQNRISKTVTARWGATVQLDNSKLNFASDKVNNVTELNKKTVLIQIKNNSTTKDLGAYFLTGTLCEEGTALTNIATNKQLDGTVDGKSESDVVSARFTHYTKIPKNEGTATVACELMLNQLYTGAVTVPLNLTLNVEEYDPSLAIVSDGTAWLTGTDVPTNSLGETYDFYLDTDDLNIYKKEETGWQLIACIKGQKGDKPTIEINELGFWVIDGELTDIKADCGVEELKQQLNGILELDNNSFEMNYQSFIPGTMWWWQTTSTFSGWGGSIGKPKNFNSLLFKVRARDVEITKITVYLMEENKDGKLLFTEELAVSVLPGEVSEIIWRLPQTISNTKDINYFFVYGCDALCDLYDAKNGISMLPDTEEQLCLVYFTNGNVGYNNMRNSSIFRYLYVQTGVCVSTYEFNYAAFTDIITDLNVIKYDHSQICLPNTIYGYINQTMQIYFENIMPYSVDDVLIRITSGARGNQFKDRWEYIPTTTERFTLKIFVYSKNYDLLSESSFNIVVNGSTSKTSANVLVIGDSTVEASSETQKMLSLAENDGSFDITLLGSMGSGQNLHEGRGGWTAKKYVETQSSGSKTNPFYNTETLCFDFSYYMNNQNYEEIDVVYLQLGINDIFSCISSTELNNAINTYTSNLDIMIESIKAYNADIKVVVNLIIPCQLDQNKFTSVYGMTQTSWGYKKNMYFANLALLEKYSDTENVYLSWYNAALDAYNNQGNDVHPTVNGYYQLGEQMYYMLKAIS